MSNEKCNSKLLSSGTYAEVLNHEHKIESHFAIISNGTNDRVVASFYDLDEMNYVQSLIDNDNNSGTYAEFLNPKHKMATPFTIISNDDDERVIASFYNFREMNYVQSLIDNDNDNSSDQYISEELDNGFNDANADASITTEHQECIEYIKILKDRLQVKSAIIRNGTAKNIELVKKVRRMAKEIQMLKLIDEDTWEDAWIASTSRAKEERFENEYGRTVAEQEYFMSCGGDASPLYTKSNGE